MKILLEKSVEGGNLVDRMRNKNDYHRTVLTENLSYPPKSMPLYTIGIKNGNETACPTIPFEVPEEFVGHCITLTEKLYLNLPTLSVTYEGNLREHFTGKEISESYKIPLGLTLLRLVFPALRPRGVGII